MPCYHPLEGFYDRLLKKVYFSSIPKVAMLTHLSDIEPIKLPCGKCIGCRLERSRKWAMRCVYEASLHAENSFLTLTYSPEFLPEGGTLVKRDLQLFMKRLRKTFPGKRIRYFACGEYGENFARPHYHVILFGFSPPDYKRKRSRSRPVLPTLADWLSSGSLPSPVIDFSDTVSSEDSVLAEYSPLISKLWGNGHVAVGDVTFESCAYVARYCLKKINGSSAKEHYGNRLPEFIVMSRRPGIAGDWFEKWKDDVFPADRCFSRGVQCKPPRYFDKLLEKTAPELLTGIKAARKNFAQNHPVPFDRLSAAEAIVQRNMQKFSRRFENSLESDR